MALVPGLYDRPITLGLLHELAQHTADRLRTQALDPDEVPLLLARALSDRLQHALASFTGDERLPQQLHLANRILQLLQAQAQHGGASPGDHFHDSAQKLLAILAPPPPGLGAPQEPTRPGLPLSESELLVNGRRDLSVGPEINKELASADRVDLLCSFLKFSGVRLVKDQLAAFLERHPGQLRVITTVYMGATQQKALDLLREMGARIKVSYDTQRTRLHAKAWLFHRASGYSTGLIGSSNLSHEAMLDGLEWNVRVSGVANPGILKKFEAVFDQYWNDPGFEPYTSAEDRDRFQQAVKRQVNQHSALLLAIQLHPRPHQERILESLAAERERGHKKNLVVAATGTGKTIVAAIDYARLCKAHGKLTLLFVAHRTEILRQSQAAFRVAMKDGSFGDLLAGGEVPRAGTHVFASVQSLHEARLAELDPQAFDVVIVDEFHHAAAPTYERLLEHLKPKYLLGLTATPERTDGKSVLGWFDGRIAAELRLWEALDQSLLCPFQYFGVSDGTDLTRVRFQAGRYDTTELSNVYTGNHIWAKRVLQAVHDKIRDVTQMKALGFCTSIAHAEFMAQVFNQAGIPAAAVSAKSKDQTRRDALHDLRSGALKILFTVDLFNEGIDLPDVDTVLFLRPTESATVFLQQLGRGLRLSDDKECLTVLDFIGNAHQRFRFDARFRAILGGTRRQVQRAVEQDFPQLPSGCAIQLERQAKELILDNIKRALGANQKALIEDLKALGRDVTLKELMTETQLDLEDLYPNADASITRLRRAANVAPLPDEAPTEPALLRSIARLGYVNDLPRIEAWRALTTRDRPPPANESDPYQRLLYVALGHFNRPYAKLPAAWDELWSSPSARRELKELLDVREDQLRRRTPPIPGTILAVHADYSLDEIAAAFDVRTQKGALRRPQGTGVLWVPDHQTDALFVTLQKIESEYTPSTLYNDYPISDRLFHWESQSTAHEATATGRRYVTHESEGTKVLLFVRQTRKDARKFTEPYTLLGPARYQSHIGGRPMQIVWELEHPIPPEIYEETKAAAG